MEDPTTWADVAASAVSAVMILGALVILAFYPFIAAWFLARAYAQMKRAGATDAEIKAAFSSSKPESK